MIFEDELHLACTPRGVVEAAEAAAGHSRRGHVPRGGIGHVLHLQAELHALGLGDTCAFGDTQVNIEELIKLEGVAPGVPTTVPGAGVKNFARSSELR